MIQIPSGAVDVRFAGIAARIDLEFRDPDGNVVGVQTLESQPIFHPHAQNFEAILDNILKEVRGAIEKGFVKSDG